MLNSEWVAGQGTPLAMLHGWGLNRRVWVDVSAGLAPICRPLLMDLPGHGHSEFVADACTLNDWSTAALATVPSPSLWLGWSLGGMVALAAAAAQPEHVRGLILVATNARFAQGQDWPTAVETTVLEGFAASLEQDYPATLARFLALQARGDERARETVRVLRQQLAEGGMPQPAALRAGLSILREADLTSALPQVRCPVLLVGGEYDNLVPMTALEIMAKALTKADLCIIKGASHAPFISHRDEFVSAVARFVAGIDVKEAPL